MAQFSKPIVTVIMPAFNAELFIEQAIESVLNQTYDKFELFIVNDGSTDKTEEVIKGFNDKRIKYLIQKNKGVSSARNLAIKHSKGQWLSFLDADDVWLPDTLATFAENIEGSDFIFGEYSYLGGPNSGKTAKDLTKISNNRESLLHELINHNFIGIGGICMRRDITNQYFDESLGFAEDYRLWITLLMKDIRVKKVNKVLYKYRIHSESALHKNNQQEYLMAMLLLGFANKIEYAKDRASQYYNDYVNAAISESLKNDDYQPNLNDYKYFILQPKTKIKLFLYMKHPKTLKMISKGSK